MARQFRASEEESVPEIGEGPAGREASDRTRRRAAIALVAAELGEEDAARSLDDEARRLVLRDGPELVRCVPHALRCLARQLAAHPDPDRRVDAARLLALAGGDAPEDVARPLLVMLNDREIRVSRAAREALLDLGLVPEPHGAEAAGG